MISNKRLFGKECLVISKTIMNQSRSLSRSLNSSLALLVTDYLLKSRMRVSQSKSLELSSINVLFLY